MTDNKRLLPAFIDYEKSRDPIPSRHNTIGMPIGTRLYRMQRVRDGWQLWIMTANYLTGTFLMCYDNGKVERWTIREDEGDEIKVVRPSDEEIRNTYAKDLHSEGET